MSSATQPPVEASYRGNRACTLVPGGETDDAGHGENEVRCHGHEIGSRRRGTRPGPHLLRIVQACTELLHYRLQQSY